MRENIIQKNDNPHFKWTKQFMLKVKSKQIAHRKEDLARLEKTFRESKDALRLGKVLLADANEQFEPQLGFNPDDF